MSQLERLIYVSKANSSLSNAGVQRIVNMAHLRNQMADITGLLINERGYFLQILEGASYEIEATFERILKDTRHEDCQLLLKEVIEQRAFTKMKMAYCDSQALMSEKSMDLLDLKVITEAADQHDVGHNRALYKLLSTLLNRLKLRAAA